MPGTQGFISPQACKLPRHLVQPVAAVAREKHHALGRLVEPVLLLAQRAQNPYTIKEYTLNHINGSCLILRIFKGIFLIWVFWLFRRIAVNGNNLSRQND